MRSKVSAMGRPLHPVLAPLPVGLLTASVVFDVVHLLTGGARWTEISFWTIALGVVGGLLAAVFAGRATVALCRCGASANEPSCDGTHKRVGFRAAQRAVREVQGVRS